MSMPKSESGMKCSNTLLSSPRLVIEGLKRKADIHEELSDNIKSQL